MSDARDLLCVSKGVKTFFLGGKTFLVLNRRCKSRLGQTDLVLRNGIFLGEMHGHVSHEEEQKKIFCCSQVVWTLELFERKKSLKKPEG